MSNNGKDNQNTPTEPQPDDPNQGNNRDPDQEPELEQLGKFSPNTTINPKIKNI